MKTRLLLAALSASSGLGLAMPHRALAAPRVPCTPAQMVPQAASIPANLPAFGYTATTATAADVHLTVAGSPGELPLAVGTIEDGYLEVKPSSPLTPGSTYTLEYNSFCSYTPYPTGPLTFVATAEAPLPTQLGVLTSGPTVTLKDFGTTQFTIQATYSIAPEMRPWAAVYRLGIVLDGELVETHPTLSAAGDAVQIDATGWCGGSSAATTKHTIRLRGALPFAPQVETLDAEQVFDCPASNVTPPPTSGGAVPPPSAPGALPNGGGASGGSTTTSSGGGCSTTSGASSSGASLALLVGLAMIARRRRRPTP